MEALLEQVNSLPSDEKVTFFRLAAEQMTILEVNNLVKSLEKAWDVSATPQMPDWAKPPTQEVEDEADQAAFDVIVTDTGAKRIAVVKVARAECKLELKEASALLKNLPATLLTKVPKDTADGLRKLLEAAGATVEVK